GATRRWLFLTGLKEERRTLKRAAFVKMCARDASVLEAICEAVEKTIKVLKRTNR
ncbi:unnamed protein product, partial [Amoebophrya sp. A25]